MAISAKQLYNDLAGTALSQNALTKLLSINTDNTTIEVQPSNQLGITANSLVDGYFNAAAAISLSKLEELVIQADGSQDFTNNQSLDGYNITSINIAQFGANPATQGTIRLSSGNNSGIWFINGELTNNILGVKLNTDDDILIGDGYPSSIICDASGFKLFDISGSGVFRPTAGVNQMLVDNLQFDKAVSTPTIQFLTNTANGATGKTTGILAQDCSGASSTGASIKLRPGQGTSTNGNLSIYKPDGTTIVLTVNNTGFTTNAAIYKTSVTYIDDTDSPYTVISTDYIIDIDPSAGVVTVYLTDSPLRELIIHISATGNTVTLDADTVAGKTIEGSTTLAVASGTYSGLILHASNDGNYYVDGQYTIPS